eukprot:CAMPEP_0201507164 /NCGR_PEP_ID=MMETSP0161_2-20130828/910_1 /ASSEMBLY_ACC=CAM_ASM_000251 /TAXON_ID=180227 /ORGANISM="Neoparamoeba aestuarina, Strain SoJaBio B1-5/56/2" /LENGTH=401 /DNA_ID=CAMNT_0047901457 /DNA_START=35 /DNA_END=1240 /DNA_ORIENTATION=-
MYQGYPAGSYPGGYPQQPYVGQYPGMVHPAYYGQQTAGSSGSVTGAAGPMSLGGDKEDQWRSLYVGNLPSSMPDMLLYEIFSTVAPIANWKIIKDKTTGKSQGYGFVDFYDQESAKIALETLNGRNIMDHEMKINWAHIANGNREDAQTQHTIFVGDLSGEVTDQVLRKAFAPHGEITDARVMMDAITGRSRGFGFVSYRTRGEAEQAMGQMNGEWLGSRAIRTNWANQKNNQTQDQVAELQQSLIENNTAVYVGNVPQTATEEQMRQLFSEFAPYIEEVRLHKGYGFVQFKSHDQAKQAINVITGRSLGDKTVKCGWGKERTNDTATTTTTPTAAAPIAYPGAAAGYSQYPYSMPQAGVDPSQMAAYYPQYYGAQYYGAAGYGAPGSSPGASYPNSPSNN